MMFCFLILFTYDIALIIWKYLFKLQPSLSPFSPAGQCLHNSRAPTQSPRMPQLKPGRGTEDANSNQFYLQTETGMGFVTWGGETLSSFFHLFLDSVLDSLSSLFRICGSYIRAFPVGFEVVNVRKSIFSAVLEHGSICTPQIHVDTFLSLLRSAAPSKQRLCLAYRMNLRTISQGNYLVKTAFRGMLQSGCNMETFCSCYTQDLIGQTKSRCIN